jgi:hypothetical protein
MDPATADRQSQFFDTEATLVTYRHVIAKREAAAGDADKAGFDAVAKQLRQSWREWQGEDSLHEMACGEP